MPWLRRVSTMLVFLSFLLLPVPALAATYTVTITDSQFVPSILKVGVGDSITFVNSTTATQSAKTTLASGFNTGNIGPGSSKSVTVSTAGTYTYSSTFNTLLSGTITVGTASSSTTLGTGGSGSTSATVRSTQPSQTQPQPVSGTFEVVMALTLAGAGLVTFGWFSRTRMAPRSSLVALPAIQAERQHDESSQP